MRRRIRRLTGGVALVTALLSMSSCSHPSPRPFTRDCGALFGSKVTPAEGTCTSPFKPVAVFGVDCLRGGPRLMLAKTWHGDDFAWGRVGTNWHILSAAETVTVPVESCLGNYAQ